MVLNRFFLFGTQPILKYFTFVKQPDLKTFFFNDTTETQNIFQLLGKIFFDNKYLTTFL